jgi:hypothetical protein
LALSGSAVLALVFGVVAVAQEALPPARTIIDRHLEASGGKKALQARSSMKVVGTMQIPASGVSGPMEVFAAKPNKVVVKVNLSGIGETVEAFDGTNGWMMSPMTGPMLMQGKDLEQRKFDSDFYGELHAEGRYKSMTTVEKTEWQGRPAYKVRLTHHNGGEDFEYYDVENGLKVGTELTRELMNMGTIKVSVTFADYKKFGALLIPATVRRNMMGTEVLTTMSSVEFDTVDPAVFEPPAAIKALIKQK